jgi:hypothetical protein
LTSSAVHVIPGFPLYFTSTSYSESLSNSTHHYTPSTVHLISFSNSVFLLPRICHDITRIFTHHNCCVDSLSNIRATDGSTRAFVIPTVSVPSGRPTRNLLSRKMNGIISRQTREPNPGIVLSTNVGEHVFAWTRCSFPARAH